MTMKKLLFTFTLVLFTLPALSQSRIIIEKGNGDSHSILWNDFRKITFDGSKVNIVSNNAATMSSEMSDIVRIATSYDNTGIDATTIEEKELLQFVSPDEVAVNCKAGEIITVYNLSGCAVSTQRQASDCGTIGIAHLPKGVYMLQADGRTVKFLKR